MITRPAAGGGVTLPIAESDVTNLTTDLSARALLTSNTFTGQQTVAAGTTAICPILFQSGTNLTSAAAGATEFDGVAFYRTVDTTQGRTQDCNQQIFFTTADGSAIGAAIADAFGANSAFSTISGAVYEINFYCWYLKSTAGTVTFTVTNTQAYSAFVGYRTQSVAGGLAANGAVSCMGLANQTTAAAAFAASSSLTDTAQHHTHIRVVCTIGTAGNIRLRVTSSAGTITMRKGSYYTVRRLYPGNVGTFVA